MRSVGTAIMAIEGFYLGAGMAVSLTGARQEGSRAIVALAGGIAGSVGFGWLGHGLGKKTDLKTFVIAIAD